MSGTRSAVRVGVLVAALVAAMLAASPGQAAHVTCGEVITTNTVLDSDVGPCPDNGLVVGADNIRIDLNGHEVFGTPDAGDGAGIMVSNHSGVMITGPGTVRDFDAGVALEGGGNHTVTGITARDNIGDIFGSEYGDGIAVLSSTDNRILDNEVVHNGPYSGIGLFQIIDADHPRDVSGPTRGNLVQGNRVLDNDVCRVNPHDPIFPPGFCDDDGIRLEPGVTDNSVIGNEVRGSALDGIAAFFQAADNDIRRNRVEDNGMHPAGHRKGDGIRVFLQADRTEITANRVFHNAANGIRVDSQDNKILGNKTGDNVAVPDPRFFLQSDLHDSNRHPETGEPYCDDNLWRGNTYDTAYPDCTKGPGQQSAGPAGARGASVAAAGRGGCVELPPAAAAASSGRANGLCR